MVEVKPRGHSHNLSKLVDEVWGWGIGEVAVSLETVQQIRRFFKILGGFTLLLVGVVMLITPGPGWLVIIGGLAMLAAEFVWARRLLDRLKSQGERLRHSVTSSWTSKA
ncbi:MAG: hypothetical protein DMG32_14880 [Acidobacteria bacterium]|nr:MAG: hypothetical protein DMG32_14880 [Acidobacteriota bacterium]